jgi:Tfp pilus assembly protein PilF
MRIRQFAAAMFGLTVFCWGIWSSARAGMGELLSYYGSSEAQMLPIGKAAELDSADPNTHLHCALVSLTKGGLPEATRALERAVQLRPRHYYLWLQLGSARDQAGNALGARAAFEEAVRLAPHYAQPRWQLGNVLLRLGLRDEAFMQLRQACASDPTQLAAMVDLAWSVCDGDTGAVQSTVDPRNDYARMILARFFAKKGRAAEALSLFRAAGQVTNQERRSLVTELLAAKSFPEAYEVWSRGQTNIESADGVAVIIDGGFEGAIDMDAPGFGWKIARVAQTISVTLDVSPNQAGGHSLRIDWSGNSDPSTPVISQLVLVEPKTHYRLSFAVWTENLVTGGLPEVGVIDAGDPRAELLQSVVLPQSSNGWQKHYVEFATSEATRALVILVRRQACTITPCPVFGKTWFDDFSLIAIQKTS